MVAIKAGKAKKKLVLEPHDIVKELRLLSSLSHPAVRLHIFLLYRVGMFTGVQVISVLGHEYDSSHSLQRFWMPFMPFTLADLLSVPTFSPILDSDVPHDSESILGFTLLTKSIIHQVLSGVAYLHSPEKQIAHRDIKPRNILLDNLGVAVLIDFGVAYSPTAGPRDVWPEPEGKMYFEVGSGYVQCLPIPKCADVDLPLSFSDLIALQSFSLVCGSTMRLLATCGLSEPRLRNSSRPFTVTPCLVNLTTIRTLRRVVIPQSHIYLTNCLSHGRVLSGNAIRYLMGHVVTSVLHGAYFALAARPRKKPGLFVSFYLSRRGYFSCLIRHSRIYLTQTRSISSIRLACTYRRCCLTSARPFHMGIKYISPLRNNDPPWLIYYNAYSFIHPIRVSRLQMRSCIRGY